MKDQKTSVFANGLIWFGAAVSIAEILTGTLLAPLGFAKGLGAIVLGHVIGCTLFFLAGLIGGQTGRNSMETVSLSFGPKGSVLFSSLNVLQLVGWTAVMIYSGATSCQTLFPFGNGQLWSLLIGGLILAWILIGIKNLTVVNLFTMGALFVLTIVLSTVVFRQTGSAPVQGTLSFGAAVELSVAMPLSWLPLVSDYTSTTKKPLAASLTSASVYFFASCWMYIIGMGAAIFTGEADIAAIMLKAGLGILGLAIIVLSTVTTTFLDVYSAGVSAGSISKKLREKPVAILACIAGTALAVLTPITKFEGFLYLISSVFAPMIAIQITDYFVLKKSGGSKAVNWRNIVLWAMGFAVYRVFLQLDTPLGNTLPVMLITMLLCIAANKVLGGKNNA